MTIAVLIANGGATGLAPITPVPVAVRQSSAVLGLIAESVDGTAMPLNVIVDPVTVPTAAPAGGVEAQVVVAGVANGAI